MSTGMVICSICQREVHQDGDKSVSNGWRHCEDKSPRCAGGSSTYPKWAEDVLGFYCGMDGPLPPHERTRAEWRHE